MKHLITLRLEIQVTLNESDASRLKDQPQEWILEECFKTRNRTVLHAEVDDEELIDDGVDSLKLTRSRNATAAQAYGDRGFISVL